jgi:hypothetical protein
MELLKHIIEIITSKSRNEQLFQKIGSVKKHIGHNIIFDSKINGVQGIGLVLIDNKISSASFVLKKAIPFRELNDVFTEYHLGYNHYDESSLINFELTDKIKLLAKKNGYINNDQFATLSFSEFELKLI